MRLKALIADDEMHIVQNLRSVIPWEELDIEVVGLARNGQMAMELAAEHQPHIVLSDIRMPGMDGLQFVEALKRQQPDAEVLMITGYQDFEYARTMIRLGVSEYILKPIDYESLELTIERLADKVRNSLEERRNAEKMWREVTSLAYQKVLYDLIMGRTGIRLLQPHGAGRSRPADEPGWDPGRRFVLLLADLESDFARTRQWSEQERKLWNFAVGNVLEESLDSEQLLYSVIRTRDGEWCVVVEWDDSLQPPSEELLKRWGSLMQEQVSGNTKLELAVAFLAKPLAPEEMALVYKRLQRRMQIGFGDERKLVALEAGPEAAGGSAAAGGGRASGAAGGAAGVSGKGSGAAGGSGRGVGGGGVSSGSGAGGGPAAGAGAGGTLPETLQEGLWEAIEAISGGFRRQDRIATEKALRQWNEQVSRLQSLDDVSWVRLEQLTRFTIMHLLRDMRDMDVFDDTRETEVWRTFEKAAGLRDLTALLHELVAGGSEAMQRKKSSDVLMHSAKDYIDRHLGRDFGLEDVADHLGISNSYFSMLFKQQFGETFVEYVTRSRMEQAKALLLQTTRSITDIGKAVGYADRRYFTKVFQRQTGTIPSEFREKNQTKELH